MAISGSRLRTRWFGQCRPAAGQPVELARHDGLAAMPKRHPPFAPDRGAPPVEVIV
jgi:hypothetical protein